MSTSTLGRWAAVPALVALLAMPVPADASPAREARVIVQLSGTPALTGTTGLRSADRQVRARDAALVRDRRQALWQAHGSFLRRLTANKITAKVSADYTEAYDGVALRLPRDQVAALARVPGVVAVHPDAVVHAAVDEDVSLVRAPQAWAANDPSGRPDDGTGEIIGIIDSGIDYTHPDLGGGFGPGHKVVAGHDFVNNDDDPMDDNGHGTHVAGIAAGDPATAGGRSGVAPKASLTAYKVFDSSGQGFDSTVLAGVEAAVDVDNPYRADVLNLSLSGPADASDPIALACEDVIRSGVVVVAAAGNDGPGESTVTSPALAPDVLAVGASVSGIDVPSLSVTSPVSRALPSTRVNLSANPPSGGEQLDLVDVGNGGADGYTGKDVSGKAVLIANPPLPSVEPTLELAEQHDARAVLFYTPKYISSAQTSGVLPGFVTGASDGGLDLVAVTINGSDAADLQAMLAKGGVRISVKGAGATDQMTGFSSHGPVLGDYRLKPDLVAPGAEVRSTWPGGGYQRDTGTSMAAPHVAGAAALVRQAHPDWSPDRVAAALTGTAHLLPGYSPVTEGAGRLDVAAAAQAPVLASPRVADLGLADLRSDRLSASTSLTLTNVGARRADLTLSTRPAPGSPAVTATASPATGSLAPGDTTTVRLTLSGARPATGGDLSGWLQVKVNGAIRLTVPYLLAVRPLELHAAPDPSEGETSAFITAEPRLTAPPSVTVTDPRGRTRTLTADAAQPGLWQVAVPDTGPGLYRVRASAPTAGGSVLTGQTGYEELKPDSGNARTGWQPVGPMGEGGPLAATPERPGRMYVMPTSSRHGGLFRTDDSGKTWHELRTPAAGDGTDIAVAADPVHPDIVYLAVSNNVARPAFQGAILSSRDAGSTWTRLPFPDVPLSDLTVDAATGALVATTSAAPWVSSDQGRTWRRLSVPSPFVERARMIGPDLYAATFDGLYVIRDALTQPTPATLAYRPDGDIHEVSDVVGNGQAIVVHGLSGLVISRDHGVTWSTAFTPPGDDPFIEAMDVVGDHFYASGTRHLWTGTPDGATWTAMATPVERARNFQVAGWPGTLLVSAHKIGVYRTADQGHSYTRVGVDGTTVRGLAVTKDGSGGDRLIAATDHDEYGTTLPAAARLTPAAQDWGRNNAEDRIGDVVLQIAVSPSDPRVLYRTRTSAFFQFAVERSADGGTSWSPVLNYHGGGNAQALLIDPADPNRVYVSFVAGLGPGLLVSHDGGHSWHQIDLPREITALAGDTRDPDRIWLGGPDGLSRSDDGGQTLTDLQTTPVSALALDPAHPGGLLIGGEALYTSDDGGRTLHKSTYADLRMRVTDLLIATDGTRYAATGAFDDPGGFPVGGRGVLRSTDGGRTWDNISYHLANPDVTSLALSPDGNWLFAGTSGGGVYRTATERLDPAG